MVSNEDEFTLENPDEICRGGLHPLAIQGIQLFNAGDYFAAHEALEEAWREEKTSIREMYRGILQVAVGYYHLQRGNYRGAIKMFTRAHNWLAPFPERCRGVNLAKLRQDFQRVQTELIHLGPERISSFDSGLLQPVEFALYL